MGLSTTHNCWSGSYSSFARWRSAVAMACGIKLNDMVGFGGGVEWSTIPSRPLNILLDHSDCDGEIRWEDCGPIADDLESILHLLDVSEPPSHSHRDDAKQFIAGLREASAAQENVEFR